MNDIKQRERVIHRKNSFHGFTLIEVLLVTVLFSICAIALFNVFSSGIKLWAHAQRVSIEEDISIFLDKFSEDLRNSFYYSGIKFNGTENKVSFASFVSTPADTRSSRIHEEVIDQMGGVQYHYDYETRTIIRSQANYSQALKHKFYGERVLVKAIDGLRFTYYALDAGGLKAYTGMQDVSPSAIYVEIRYRDEVSDRSMSRFISIPVGL